MFNYHEILETNPLFQGQTYSKRDAFRWIILNSKDNKAFVSISLLSSKWNWHSSKVKRFLNRLQEEKLITKAIKSGKLCLNLVAQDRTENRPAPQHAYIAASHQNSTNIKITFLHSSTVYFHRTYLCHMKGNLSKF